MRNMEDFESITISEKVNKLVNDDCLEAWVLQSIINFEKEYGQPCLCIQELAHSVGCGDTIFSTGILNLLELELVKHFKVVIDGEVYHCYKSNI